MSDLLEDFGGMARHDAAMISFKCAPKRKKGITMPPHIAPQHRPAGSRLTFRTILAVHCRRRAVTSGRTFMRRKTLTLVASVLPEA